MIINQLFNNCRLFTLVKVIINLIELSKIIKKNKTMLIHKEKVNKKLIINQDKDPYKDKIHHKDKCKIYKII